MKIEKKCERCNHIFYIYSSEKQKGRGRFCSWNCRRRPITRYCLMCKKPLGNSAQRKSGFNVKYCRSCYFKDENYKEILLANSFIKGFTPWNKNKKGVMPTPWNKGKPNLYLRKPKKSSLREQRHQEMKRFEYIVWRQAVFIRDDYTCQHCGKRGGELNADHIKTWKSYPELRYAIDNGQTLCINCHREKTRKDMSALWQIVKAL